MADNEGKGLFQFAGPPDDIDWPEHATLPPAPWEPSRFELMDSGPIDLGVDKCRAKRWNGEPSFDGPHEWHFFYYGPPGPNEGHLYMGSCTGYTEDDDE